ncbi:MAG: CBS domain-containing protein [Brevinematia bacterium]
MSKRKTSSIQNKVFEYLSKVKAGDIVLPRPHVVVCYEDSTSEELMNIFREYKYSRIPIVNRDSDNIISYVYFKDFFVEYISNQGKVNLNKIKRKIVFVPENMNLLDVFKLMNKNFTNIVVVVDEYGNHIGIVTSEDIFEKVFGEILDESDNKEDEELEIVKKGENEYLVSAWVPIEEIVSQIGLEIDEDFYQKMDVRTILGFLMYLTGNIPKYGEVYEYKNFIFRVAEIENNRISKIVVKRK